MTSSNSNRGVRVRAVTPVLAALTATVSLAAAVFGGGVAGAQPSQGGISDAPAPVPAPSAPAVVPPEAQTPSPVPVIWRASPMPGVAIPTAPREAVPSEVPGVVVLAPLKKYDGLLLADDGAVRNATLNPENAGIAAQQVAPVAGIGAGIGAGVGVVPGLAVAVPAAVLGTVTGGVTGAVVGTVIGVLVGGTVGGTVGVMPGALVSAIAGPAGAIIGTIVPGAGNILGGLIGTFGPVAVGAAIGTIGGGVIGGGIGLLAGIPIGAVLGAAGLGGGAAALVGAPGAAVGAALGGLGTGAAAGLLWLEDLARAKTGHEPLPLPITQEQMNATAKTVSVPATAAVQAPMDLAGQAADAVRGFAAQHPQIGQVASGLLEQTIGSIAASAGSVGDAVGGSVGSLAPASSAPVAAPVTAPAVSPIDAAMASIDTQVNQVKDTIAAGLGVRL